MVSSARPQDPTTDFLDSFSYLDLGRELRQDKAYLEGVKTSRVLVHSKDLTIVLIALKAGAGMKEHHAQGPATAMVLEGEIAFRSAPKECEYHLKPLQSAVFSKDVLHSVEAIEDTLMLVTMGGQHKER